MDGIVILWKVKKDFNVLTILSSFEPFRLIFISACILQLSNNLVVPLDSSGRRVFRYGLEFFIHKQPRNLVSSATLDPCPMIYDLPPLHTRRRDLIGTV